MNCTEIYTWDPRRVKRALNQLRQYRRQSLTRPPKAAPPITGGNLFWFDMPPTVYNFETVPSPLLTLPRISQTRWRRLLRAGVRQAIAAGLPRYASDTEPDSADDSFCRNSGTGWWQPHRY